MHPAVENLVALYRDRVQPRMRALPVYNAALEVEAVGFDLHAGRLCGVLIAPWCMNLVVMPGEHDDWSALAPGTALDVAFPAGEYACLLSAPDDGVRHLSLPLFTTVEGFTDQDTARNVAREVLRRLYHDAPEPAHAEPIAAELNRSGLHRPVSRRALLHGWLAPPEDGA